MIRIGIIGTGRTVSIAQKHFQAIQKDGRAVLGAVLNGSVDSAQKWICDNNSQAKACRTADEFFNLTDAAIICSPNNSHLQYAKLANSLGKAVLIEKPLSIDYERAVDAVKEWRKDVFTSIGFVYRFSNCVQELKKLVKERIGKVYFINASMGGRRLADPNVSMEWRMKKDLSGSGALCDFGSHLIDVSYYLTGDRINGIASRQKTIIKERRNNLGEFEKVETDDIATLSGDTDNGMVNYLVSRVGFGDMKIELAGEGGAAEAVISGANKDVIFLPKVSSGGYLGKTESIVVQKENFFDDWFDRQMEDFLNGIEGKPTIGATLADGLYNQSIIDLAEKI